MATTSTTKAADAPAPTCSRCGNDPTAPCAGHHGCHGFWEGCDCKQCEKDWKVMRAGSGWPGDPNEPKPI
jgi:hypothetical protein